MWITAFASHPASGGSAAAHVTSPPIDGLMLLGGFCTFMTFVFFVYQHESRSAMWLFATCLAVSAISGLIQGSWSLGIIVAIWAGSMFHRSYVARGGPPAQLEQRSRARMASGWESQSRLERLFGPR